MSANSLRELVIQSALEILDRDGLELRPDSISYAKVFGYLENRYSIRVTRGSVHERIWDTHDDFRREVLAEALASYPAYIRARDALESEASFRDFLGRNVDRERRAIDFARSAGTKLWDEALQSRVFGDLQSLKAIASRFNDPIASEVLRESLAKRAQSRLESRRPVVAAAWSLLGRRAKRELCLSPSEANGLFYLLNITLSVGGHLNYRAGCRDLGQTVELRTGPSGEYESHSIAAVAFRAALEFFSELVPADEVADPLAQDLDLPPIDPRPDGSNLSSTDSGGQRRSREELKRLVLAAGLELLLEDGLVLKPESLRYSSVLAHIQEHHGITVSRASVHGRIWASHEEFCHEVLARGVRLGGEGNFAPAPDLNSELTGRKGRLKPLRIDDDGSDPPLQHALEVLRVASEKWIDSLADSPHYRRQLLIKASLQDRSESDGMDELRRAIQDTDRRSTDLIERFVRERLLPAGFIVRPELGLSTDAAVELTGTLAQAIFTGVVFNRVSGIETVTHRYRIRRHDGSGQFDDWTAASIALRAYFEFLYCWDPTATGPIADDRRQQNRDG